MRFRAVLQLGGKTATGIEVPADVVASLGPGKRPAVRVTIKEYTYRSTVAPMGGRFMIPVSADVRAKAGVAAGDELDIDIELDTQPREVTVPADLAAALAGDVAARQAFDALSYSRQLRHVLAIEGAKTPQTRQRRIGAAIGELRQGQPQR
jgi:uncharacterized protein DUF1905/bacteriocin resistance YdeI/OmpD-like protein